jgi:hypothetical protein
MPIIMCPTYPTQKTLMYSTQSLRCGTIEQLTKMETKLLCAVGVLRFSLNRRIEQLEKNWKFWNQK